jgi:hypothetical protein
MTEQRYHLCAPPQHEGPIREALRFALPPALLPEGRYRVEEATADDADVDLILLGADLPSPHTLARWLDRITPPGEGWIVWLS